MPVELATRKRLASHERFSVDESKMSNTSVVVDIIVVAEAVVVVFLSASDSDESVVREIEVEFVSKFDKVVVFVEAGSSNIVVVVATTAPTTTAPTTRTDTAN